MTALDTSNRRDCPYIPGEGSHPQVQVAADDGEWPYQRAVVEPAGAAAVAEVVAGVFMVVAHRWDSGRG
ncbi:MAG: hypothetical protein ACYCS7_09110 [Acidimicrobiales bacterium]